MTNELIRYALKALDIIYQPGFNFMKCGVMVQDIKPEDAIQHALFDSVDRSKNKTVMHALDKVNKALGKDLVRFAAQGFEKKYRLRAGYLSKRYTTNMNELLTIKSEYVQSARTVPATAGQGVSTGKKYYLVSQTFQRGRDVIKDESKEYLLLSHYDDKGHALIHKNALPTINSRRSSTCKTRRMLKSSMKCCSRIRNISCSLP